MEPVNEKHNWWTSNYFNVPLTLAIVAGYSHYFLLDSLQLTVLKVSIVPLSFMSDTFIAFRYVSEASKTKWTKPFLEKQLMRAFSFSGFIGTFLWSGSESLSIVLSRYIALITFGFVIFSLFPIWQIRPPTTK